MSLCTTFLASLSPSRPLGNRQMPSSLVGVRRNLFGSAGASAKSSCEAELQRMTKKSCKKWNFDFPNEQPLPVEQARYQWEIVGAICVKSSALTLRTSPMDVGPVERRPSTKKSPKTAKPKRQQKVLTMTDFMQSRKRKATPSTAKAPTKMQRLNVEPPLHLPEAEQPSTSQAQKSI